MGGGVAVGGWGSGGWWWGGWWGGWVVGYSTPSEGPVKATS